MVDSYNSYGAQQSARKAALAAAGRKRAANELECSATQGTSDNMPKKAKTTALSSASALSSSTVNINISNPIPLSDRAGQRHINTPIMSPADKPLAIKYLPTSPTSSSNVTSSPIPATPPDYPTINIVLEDLHNAFPSFNLPQYFSAFRDFGMVTVEDVRNVSDDNLVKTGLPLFVLDHFREHAERLALGAEGYGVSAPRF